MTLGAETASGAAVTGMRMHHWGELVLASAASATGLVYRPRV